tara:strand:- start:946 stop:1167 length:222 start_codon:yes stop_codon:yes gene_type:complete
MDKLDYETYFGTLMDKTDNMNHWLNEGKEIMKKDKKHPYYDSDRKKKLESDSLKAIFICFVGMIVLLLISAWL